MGRGFDLGDKHGLVFDTQRKRERGGEGGRWMCSLFSSPLFRNDRQWIEIERRFLLVMIGGVLCLFSLTFFFFFLEYLTHLQL